MKSFVPVSAMLQPTHDANGVRNPARLAAMLAAGQAPMVPRAAKTGTLSIDDLRAVTYQSAAGYGIDTISQVFERDLAVHNAITADLVGEFADITTDRQRIYGTSNRGEMIEVDEFGRAPTQKVKGGTTSAFPMSMFQYAVGWTRKYLQNASTAEVADQLVAAKLAHTRRIARQLKRAIFLSANYTFNDFLVDKIDLGVKRLLNADSASIPDGPNGEQFVGSSHTHYVAINGLTAAALKALINNVVEHGHGGQVRVIIAQADEAAVRALSGFNAYLDPRLTLGTQANQPGKRLDITRLDNRAIGIFEAAEVWVKPWGIASYIFAYDAGTTQKPLVLRTRNGNSPALTIAATIDTFPLYAEYLEAEFGFGVWTRTNGAVLYTGGGAYVDPTIS